MRVLPEYLYTEESLPPLEFTDADDIEIGEDGETIAKTLDFSKLSKASKPFATRPRLSSVTI